MTAGEPADQVAWIQAAAGWHVTGHRVVPVAGPDKADRKRPYGMRWQRDPLSLPTIRALLGTGQHPGFGVATGTASRHLEGIDVEGRSIGPRWDRVKATATDRGLADLLDRVFAGYLERTPSGGWHTFWRCPDGVAGNLKLAQTPGPPDSKGRPTVKPLIETRGEGGFIVVAPSPGYSLVSGGPATLVTVTADERKVLLDLLRSADEMPPPPPRTERPAGPTGDRIGDQFTAHTSWAQVLQPHGWVQVGTGGRGETLWRRPGKDWGWSATTGATSRDTLHVFSTSTLFATSPTSYSKFGAYAVLNHGGDFTAAARALTAAEQHEPAGRNGQRRQPPAGVAPATRETVGPAPAPAADAGLWTAHSTLAHIRSYALATRVRPEALLGMTLAQVLARIEPTVVLPPLLGAREGSLNTVGALIGYSGTGKGLAYDASWQVFHWAVPVVVGKFGSGEGLVDLYAFREKDPADKTQWIVNQHTTRAIVYTAEITTLRALLERSGSTLLGGLCEVYSGEGLGFGYRNREKGVQIPDHSYRASLAFGVQPANADTLLAAVETGLPQRVCWWPATVADPPAVRPDPPAPLTWAPPLALRDLKVNPHTGRRRLPVCTQAAVDVDTAFVRRCQQGKLADPLASHDMQTRLKLAAALTVLLRSVEISEEVWQLSGVVAAISTGMRSQVCADLAEAAAQRNRQRGQADGQRAVAAKQTEAAETEAQIQRVAPKILKHLAEKAAGRWITRNTLRSGLRSTDRLYFNGAVEHLVDTGMVTQRPVAGTGQPGVEYKAAQS